MVCQRGNERVLLFSQPTAKETADIKQRHLHLKWQSSTVLFTLSEVVELCRRFDHPGTEKLIKILRRASPEHYTPETRRFLADIFHSCMLCQRKAPKLFLFQFTLPDNILFITKVMLDLMWIELRPHTPVLHTVGHGTKFSVPEFLTSEAQKTSGMLLYLTGFLFTQDSQMCCRMIKERFFTSEFLNESCVQFGIIPKATPTDSHNSLGPG